MVVWEDFEEDIFFTDGNYRVRYRFTEDSIELADTGINFDYTIISGLVFLTAGLVLFTSSRKRKLLQSDISLEDIYENAFKVKTKIEKLIDSKVQVNIDINKFAPYGKSFVSYSSEIRELNNELEYTLVAIENIKKISAEKNEVMSKEILADRLGLISNNFQIIYTSEDILDSKELQVKTVKKNQTKNIKRKFFERKRIKQISTSFATLLILTGIGFGIYTTQQMYFSDEYQENAQNYLETVYLGEPAQEKPEFFTSSNPFNIIQSDNPVFDFFGELEIIDNVLNSGQYEPKLFGLLEIPNISIRQYIVSGTGENDLQFGPGHYIQTNLPGSGGNVGIAGHRTTYGAPFNRLDQVEIGDEIRLSFGSNKYLYIVDEILIVSPNDDYVLYNRGQDRITLTTCHPKYSARQRLVVSGILSKIESVN